MVPLVSLYIFLEWLTLLDIGLAIGCRTPGGWVRDRDRGGGRGPGPTYECEFSTKNFKIQINFKNLTLLAPLTFKKTTFWLRPWAGYVKRDTR